MPYYRGATIIIRNDQIRIDALIREEYASAARQQGK
jgi:hypothetical protein